jgi:hypothetical protein
MMKTIFLLIAATALVSCQRKEHGHDAGDGGPDTLTLSRATNAKMLIVPGAAIGNVRLGADASELDSLLGKPDLSDSAMGKSWMTWFSKVHDTVTGNELNIYTTYKDNSMTSKVVRQVRITSEEFKTSANIGSGSTIDEVRKAFPDLSRAGSYDTETPRPTAVYDATAEGIAFEFEDSVCTGVIIHPKGRKVSEEYITFHPDMKPM